MTIITFGGFEHGDKAWVATDGNIDILEFAGNDAAARLSFNTGEHTGQGGMLFDDTAGTFGKGKVVIARPDGSDLMTGLSEAWFTFYFKRLVSSQENAPVACIGGISLQWSFSGTTLTLTGSTSSSSYTVSDTDWHKIEIKLVPNSTAEFFVDGTSIGTANPHAGSGGNAYLNGDPSSGVGWPGKYAYDDWVISTTRLDFDPQVYVLAPSGAGNYTAWTGSVTDVDDLDGAGAEDSDTSYINSSTSGQAETVALEDSAAASNGAGVTGNIKAVKSQALIRDEGGASSIAVRLRSGSTDDDTSNYDPGAAYASRGKVYELNPDGSVAWASAALDALEVGVVNNASVAARCTALGVMVLTDGEAPPPVAPDMYWLRR